MMDCKEVRKVLWPADVLRVSDDEVEAALQHAENCSSCEKFLEEDRRMAQFVRESVPRVHAPRELRERLYTVLARERAGVVPSRQAGRRKRRLLAVSSLAVVALVLASAGHWLIGRGQSAAAATAFAEDYLRRVVEQEELRTADPQQIASFFARELGVAMPPPQIPDFEVQRATICLMNGRRGGVVEYEGKGRHLTYYLLPLGEGAETEPAGLKDFQVGDATYAAPALAREQGLGVATWWDGKHQHALVGDLPSQELKRLAPLFACPASGL